MLAGRQGPRPIILKMGMDNKRINVRSRSPSFANCGGVQLLVQAEDALLLERILPGTSLKNFFPEREIESIHIMGKVIERLHHVPFSKGYCFPTVEKEVQALLRPTAIPGIYLQKAQALSHILLQSSGPDRLLHGDLHPDNIFKT